MIRSPTSVPSTRPAREGYDIVSYETWETNSAQAAAITTSRIANINPCLTSKRIPKSAVRSEARYPMETDILFIIRVILKDHQYKERVLIESRRATPQTSDRLPNNLAGTCRYSVMLTDDPTARSKTTAHFCPVPPIFIY